MATDEALRLREELRARLREELHARLAARPKLLPADPVPREDDEFVAGLKALDDAALELSERTAQPESLKDVVDRVMQKLEERRANAPAIEDTTALARQRERDDKIRYFVARGIPRDAAELIVDDALQDTPAVARARQFLDGPPGTLVISGGVGSGKTVAASWAVSQRPSSRSLRPGGEWPVELWPMFLDVGRLLRLPRYGQEANEAFRPLEECALLAIDDVGNEVGDIVGTLDALVVARHAGKLRTILTTNTKVDEFRRRYGERVYDRIKGAGAYCELADPSRRGLS